MGSAKDILMKLTDPQVKWYVYPSLNFQKRIYGNVTATNQTLYLCDDALCFPVRFNGYLSWYDPSTGGVGSRVFANVEEAWDHTNETNNTTASPRNGRFYWIPGYRGYCVGIHLTNGTNLVQVNVIHRYTDGAILIFNTGSPTNITVRVNDPPSGLGYSKQTNGTTGAGYTDIAGGRYVLFYKGTTAPGVDTTNGVFATSPLGSSKSLDYEFYTNNITIDSPSITIPKMYLGIRSRSDRELYTGARSFSMVRAGSGMALKMWGLSDNRGGINTSSYFLDAGPVWHNIYDSDPYASQGTWAGGNVSYQVWSGWGEVDGNVKYAVLAGYYTKHTTKWEPRHRGYGALIYDFDEDTEYEVHIGKPLVNVYCYGEGGAVIQPWFENLYDTNASALLLLNADDTYTKITTPASVTWTYHDNIYGFCNYFSNGIVCAEGIAIYTDDANLAISNPKSAFGAARLANQIGAGGPRVPPWGDKTWTAGKLYIAVFRLKQFPTTTSDTDLVNWMKSIPPKVLDSTEVNGILSKPPFSLWLFGTNISTLTINVPSSASPGQTVSISVSAGATYANKTAWALLIDANNNVLARASTTLDANGNGTISLTIPSNISPGTYRVRVIVAGDRTLP